METFLAQTTHLFVNDAPRVLFILCLFCLIGIFEMIFPAHAGQSIRGRARNLVFLFVLLTLGTSALSLLSFSLSVRFPLLPLSTPVILLALFCSLLMADIIYYWYHRAQHAFPWLWSIHELHHADTEVNATTAMRTYWLEYPVQILFISIPVHGLVGVNATILSLSMLIAAFLLVFTHANVKLHLGQATPLIVGPQLHRIHHSRLPKHQDKNFAQYFPFIDKVFGTYYAPKHDEFPRTGTPTLASDAPVLTVLLRPFRLWVSKLY